MATLYYFKGTSGDVAPAGECFTVDEVADLLLGTATVRGMILPTPPDLPILDDGTADRLSNRLIFVDSVIMDEKAEELFNADASQAAYEGKPAPPIRIYGDALVCTYREARGLWEVLPNGSIRVYPATVD